MSMWRWVEAMTTAIRQAMFGQRLDYHEILALVPYRAPWLGFDRVQSWDDKRITVIKALSGSDPNLASHMPLGPSIIAGTQLIEIVNQAYMLLQTLLGLTGQRSDGEIGIGLLGSCSGRFLGTAHIGDVITVTATTAAMTAAVSEFTGEIRIGDRLIGTTRSMGFRLASDAADVLHAPKRAQAAPAPGAAQSFAGAAA